MRHNKTIKKVQTHLEKFSKMGKVRSPKDLSRGSIEKVLQDHFNDSKLKVISVKEDDDFLAQNDNFNSQIKKWTVVVEKNGPTTG